MSVPMSEVIADVVVPAVVPTIRIPPSVRMESWRNVTRRRESCIASGKWYLRLEDVAKEASVRRLRISRSGLHAPPNVGVRLVGKLDLGEEEQPVPTVVDRATCEASDPHSLPVPSGLTCPHLVLAGAERENVTLKVRCGTVLFKFQIASIQPYAANDV